MLSPVADAALSHGAAWLWLAAMLPALGGAALLLHQRHRAKGLSAAQRAAAQLDAQSSLDRLTGLPDRAQFEERLSRAELRRHVETLPFTVLVVGLDSFKPVNDSFGRDTGDEVLRQVARRLQDMAHAASALARVGGDEFVLLVRGPAQRGTDTAQRVMDELARPYRVLERDLTLACSVGISVFPEQGPSARLVQRAYAAMQAVKRSGGDAYAVYEPTMDADSRMQAALVQDLRVAVETRTGLELYYQPKIHAASGQITAAEALLRWHHPSQGLILPGVFIPIAERFGMIAQLGNWVIEDACRQAREWKAKGLRMRVAINLSAYQMRQDDCVERIERALQANGIEPSRFTCEITESVAMENTEATQRAFERMRKAGVHVSIDDFGTGHSSLAYLRRLPAAELKIDRSFVTDLATSADARAIVTAILSMARALGLKVVAEGVETEDQSRLLVEYGCDELQGYLFARPMSARALTAWAVTDRDTETDGFRRSLYVNTLPVPLAMSVPMQVH